jgi:hypothetical protein
LTQDFIVEPGDETILSGSTEAFVRNADTVFVQEKNPAKVCK